MAIVLKWTSDQNQNNSKLNGVECCLLVNGSKDVNFSDQADKELSLDDFPLD